MAGSMPENLRGHWPTFHLSGKGGPTPGNWSFIAELAEFDMKIVRNSIPHNVRDTVPRLGFHFPEERLARQRPVEIFTVIGQQFEGRTD
jgi:hypothetical protein